MKAYSKSQLKVRTKYRGVIREKYEQEHPGRIQAKGMKVIKAKADGKWCELVMLPKLPEGEFDIDTVDLSGVEISETHGDGSCIVAENQLQSKLDALAQRTVGEAHASRGNRALEEQAELEEAEQVRVDSNDEDDDASKKRRGLGRRLAPREGQLLGRCRRRGACLTSWRPSAWVCRSVEEVGSYCFVDYEGDSEDASAGEGFLGQAWRCSDFACGCLPGQFGCHCC